MSILLRDIVKATDYQRDLLRLITSLTTELVAGQVRAAKSDAQAFDAIVAFRRRWDLKILDCDPLYYVAGLHRAIIRHPLLVRQAEKIPPDSAAMQARGIINYSEHWLIRQGLGTDLDTEFNPRPEKNSMKAAQQRLAAASEPDWRGDPTYDLRAKKKRRQ